MHKEWHSGYEYEVCETEEEFREYTFLMATVNGKYVFDLIPNLDSSKTLLGNGRTIIKNGWTIIDLEGEKRVITDEDELIFSVKIDPRYYYTQNRERLHMKEWYMHGKNWTYGVPKKFHWICEKHGYKIQ